MPTAPKLFKLVSLGKKNPNYLYPKVTNPLIDKKLNKAGMDAGLQGELLWRFKYMMLKTGYWKALPEYLTQQAWRFANKEEYFLFDTDEAAILAKYDKHPIVKAGKNRLIRAYALPGQYEWIGVK